ncbi:MAG: hydroxypyruvate reductase [Candidatus Binatia bacterium]|nr:MAG: hydroxypyruvate reductase [Candidatus Binatia bacterium]
MARGREGETVPLGERACVLAVGKAAGAMARASLEVLPPDRIGWGFAILPDGHDTRLGAFDVRHASHPLPDERGFRATREVVRRVAALRPDTSLLLLLSGGASSLFVFPRAPLSLAEKIETNRLLLDSGADIAQVNAVRKHLSEVKGGGLLRHTKASVWSLVLSDVVGDDPSVVGSGPGVADPSTFEDVAWVFDSYGLWGRVPERVAKLVRAGCEGQVWETLKPWEAAASRGKAIVVGSNRDALGAARRKAEEKGWRVFVEPSPLVGDTRRAAGEFARRLVDLVASGEDKVCLLAGGETTVEVRGRGRGGRNQEFALALAPAIDGLPVRVLSAGTDGIDGPTDAAGAFVDGSTLRRAREKGLDPDAFLAENDSYTFFELLGDLFQPGPTGTNVMDLKIALLERGAP